jgi:hypothetical protein
MIFIDLRLSHVSGGRGFGVRREDMKKIRNRSRAFTGLIFNCPPRRDFF